MPKDQNSVAPMYGISNVNASTILPIQIDPVTNRIIAEITIISSSNSVLSGANAAKDGNSSATILCQKDDSSGNLVPVMDHTNKILFVDLLKE